MSTLAIPVTYPGTAPYALEFRLDHDSLYVRRDLPTPDWRPVHTLNASPLPDSPDRMIVEINRDIFPGLPIFAIMARNDWDRIRSLKQ